MLLLEKYAVKVPLVEQSRPRCAQYRGGERGQEHDLGTLGSDVICSNWGSLGLAACGLAMVKVAAGVCAFPGSQRACRLDGRKIHPRVLRTATAAFEKSPEANLKKATRRSFLLSSAVGAVGVAGLAQAADAPATDGPPTGSQPTYHLTREIPAEEGFDLVVAGGGPAGTAAAVCAARLGAKVLLVEPVASATHIWGIHSSSWTRPVVFRIALTARDGKAYSERWILITNDKDFGEKVHRDGRPITAWCSYV